MEQYLFQAYEALGHWTITVSRRWVTDDAKVWTELLYRGDHSAIDEEDPVLRAVLLLGQVFNDLSWSIRSEEADISDNHKAQHRPVDASQYG